MLIRTIVWDAETLTIPETAVVTITENCESCGFVVKTLGRKMACGNAKIQAERPYIEGTENSRKVEAETIPQWCPLRRKDPTNK